MSSSGSVPKVAIPRLPRSENAPEIGSSVAANKSKVGRACTNCRRSKAKCTGDIPRCERCQKTNQTCTYEKGRRDRLQKANEHIATMVQLLIQLKDGVSKEAQRKIEDVLEAVDDDGSSVDSAGQRTGPTRESLSEPSEGYGERQVSAGVGSNRLLDCVDEDLVRTEKSRATGFIGKSSEIQWWQDLRYELENRLNSEGDRYGPPGVSEESFAARMNASRRDRSTHAPSSIDFVSTSSFYLDDDELQLELDFVDTTEIPPREIAERLTASYIDTVQDSFPILPKSWLEETVPKLYEHLNQGWPLELVDDGTLAILNLVFAIGTKFHHLALHLGQPDDLDHIIYQTRARRLGFKDTVVVTHADVPQIRLAGLLSFYFLSIGLISRAWYTIGGAVRSAYALGLHLRNEDPSASTVKREEQVRTWWALYSLERVLCTITGRPSIITDEVCAVPLPLPLAEEQLTETMIMSQVRNIRYKTHNLYQTIPGRRSLSSPSGATSPTGMGTATMSLGPPNSGIYLNTRVKLNVIIGKALASLYMADLVTKSWEEAQAAMKELASRLEEWVASLPPAYDFREQSSATAFQRERMSLGLNYYSAKILITWPCFCKLDRVDHRVEKQTLASTSFDQEMGEVCVDAAKALTTLLPDSPDPTILYTIGPWWSIVHYFMQALAVLMLEMAYEAIHMVHDGQMIEPCVKKLIRWLGSMKERNLIADKAYRMALVIVHTVATRVHADISDLLREDLPDFFELVAEGS